VGGVVGKDMQPLGRTDFGAGFWGVTRGELIVEEYPSGIYYLIIDHYYSYYK
jgi:hypothetical protein